MLAGGLQVLDTHLKTHEWLAADQYTIADIANFSWVGPAHLCCSYAHPKLAPCDAQACHGVRQHAR